MNADYQPEEPWATIGSIVGTFATGFYLIARFGTVETVWGIGVVLLIMSIAYSPKSWLVYVWAVIFFALMFTARGDAKWANSIGSKLLLRKTRHHRIIYETESQYSYISVRQLVDVPNVRFISFNNDMAGNRINLDDIRDLRDPYMKIYAAITSRLHQNKDPLSVLILGGGGYAYPRYVEDVWPKSRIDVVEIDPQVTEAAIKALGLSKDNTFNILTMDGRNYVDELLQKQDAGQDIPRYNFVYGDCFNDFAVPYQLVTKEFNDKIAAVLTDDGVYMLNVIDMYDSGKFLGALANTIKQTFPTFYIVSQSALHSRPNSFVIIAAKKHFSIEGLSGDKQLKRLKLEILTTAQIHDLGNKAQQVVLTDNYVPVENLLSPAVVKAFHNKQSETSPW